MSAGALDEVAAMSAQFFAAVIRGDVTAAENMHTDDSVVLAPNRRIIQGTSAKAFWRGMAPRIHNKLQFTVASVDLIGEGAAREVGRFAFTPKRDNAEQVQFKYLILWQNVGSKWKIAAMMWNLPQGDRQGQKGGAEE